MIDLPISRAAMDHMMAEALQEAQRRLEMRRLSDRDYEWRGNNARLPEYSNHPEVVLDGPAGTGKTQRILHYINELMWEYPRAKALIVRKVRADLADSVLATFERFILGEENPICNSMNRENRRFYRYPNGSEIAVGGMDRPGRILSAEYDIIYAAEAVQLSLDDWETLLLRNRATFIPFQQVIGDTNPDRPDHWIKQREAEGLIEVLPTTHKDNPKYWDEEKQEWTEDGKNYVLGKLNRLTGVRRDRYRDGRWVIAEGAIYDEWDEKVHVIDSFDIPKTWTRFISVDFGYIHPFVAQWWALDEDQRMYLYREIYMTQRLVEDHAGQINRFVQADRDLGATITFMVCDHDAEGVATLRKYTGLNARKAEKTVLDGIDAVKSRLRVQDDGRPRLFLFRDALVERDPDLAEDKLPLCTKDEIPGYVWNDRKTKEEPVKENDHGVDGLRYAVMALDGNASPTPMRASVVRRHGGRRRR